MIALLAALLVFQESPADFLKKVEEKYAAAKSFSAKAEIAILSIEAGKETERGKIQGSFRSKGEGQVRVEYAFTISGKSASLGTYTSDGRQIAIDQGGRPAEKKDHKLALGIWSRRYLVRAGMMSSISSVFGSIVRGEAVNLEERFKVSEVTERAKEKVGDVECRLIECTVAAPQPKASALRARLWIDPEKGVVLKREIIDGSVVVRETITDTTFDAELADDAFKVP